jgi:hypothetical protein
MGGRLFGGADHGSQNAGLESRAWQACGAALGQEAFAVIRDTIAKLNMVALGRVVLARREHVIALEPKDRGLVGMTL